LRFSPLVKASWADASGIERVPRMTTLAEPLVFLPWRPAAKRAADVRWFRLAGLLLFLKLAIQNDRFRGVGHNRTFSHTVDRFTEGCLRVIMSKATHASNPVLRRSKDNEEIRPLSANRNTVKALEQRGLISPGKGREPLTIVWRLKNK
jgi:hypothetical protein